ncbi:NADH oxidoreductase HCR [Thalassocella blandensis]|nr:NADH oxidoreductase HCR [Thalassocella blandensis]
MSEHNVLNGIVGYQEVWQSKAALEKTGSNFQEIKQDVQKTVERIHPKRLSLKVDRIIEETASTKTFRLVSSTGAVLPPFQAGQYINVFVDINGVATARPYAIASSPAHRHYYDLTIKRAEGGFVSHFALDQLKEEQALTSSGPMGTFHHNPLFHGEDLVFLAGGSGSVPARSMLLDILERNLPYRFHLIYVNSFEHDVIYAKELRALASTQANFTLTEVVTRPTSNSQGHKGRLTTEFLSNLVPSITDKMFYICGPTPFNESCITLLTQLGVKRRRIRVEANGAPKRPDLQQNWPEGVSLNEEVTVTVKGKGSYKTRVGEPLLNSLETHGFSTENACRSGECSLCRVKLVSGTVFNPSEAHLRKSDRKFGWIYSCVAFPTSDIEVLL